VPFTQILSSNVVQMFENIFLPRLSIFHHTNDSVQLNSHATTKPKAVSDTT
jgi:hypothetical protein